MQINIWTALSSLGPTAAQTRLNEFFIHSGKKDTFGFIDTFGDGINCQGVAEPAELQSVLTTINEYRSSDKDGRENLHHRILKEIKRAQPQDIHLAVQRLAGKVPMPTTPKGPHSHVDKRIKITRPPVDYSYIHREIILAQNLTGYQVADIIDAYAGINELNKSRGNDLSLYPLFNKKISKNQLIELHERGVNSFVGIEIMGADLRKIGGLSGLDCRGADFSNCNLEGLDAVGSNFEMASFRNAQMNNMDCSDSSFAQADLTDADTTDVTWASELK
jgi:hypothetical protein